MKIKNLKIKPKAVSMVLAGTLATATLTGCGNRSRIIGKEYDYNKAIIFGENSATIIEIESWSDVTDREQLQLKTKDGAIILTSSYDTKLINDNESDIKAEDLVRSILGEEAQMNYLEDVPKTR